MTAPDSVKLLIETFDTNIDFYKSGPYKEYQLRQEFLDPLFTALGWDMDNSAGLAPQYREVIHEASIKVGGATKAPDYAFSIHGEYKFFLEAKKPAVDVRNDSDLSFQLRRYGWSAKLPVSILSDFEEFTIYDCRTRPKPGERSSNSRLEYFKYTDYIEKWDELRATFSKDAIERGAFDKYTVSAKRHRGSETVDDVFLEEIERWRSLLAKNFALRNPSLSVRDLNFAVQKTIDRVIFLRICEDRGIEDYRRLGGLLEDENIYTRLLDQFKAADDRYNSGLFHLSAEKGREIPDNITPGLQFDDKVLKEIISKLYYPDSPYEFSVLPADILGQVYEQFLGKTIRLTNSHKAKIEEKPEVRKAGGVYYTPSYIADYMVSNTLGRLLNGGNPGKTTPIPISKAAEIKVLDPACGSGSFLIVAFQYFLDWHLHQYTADPDTEEPNQGKISRHSGGKTPKIYQAPGGVWKLTTDERKRILLNNIFGVDIDAQAVEVTKLSLLLKVIEGEAQQIKQRDWIRQRQRILPDLEDNIKCGNSLIGLDFYADDQMLLLDEETQYRVNVFDWQKGFPAIMQGGGFDCVIGNPPYIDIKGFPEHELSYIFKFYSCANNRINTFATFMERSFSFIQNSDGYCSTIVPTAMLAQSSYSALRKKIMDEATLLELVRLPNESFGSAAGEVKVDTVIVTWVTPRKTEIATNLIAYRGYERISSIDPATAHVRGELSVNHVAKEPDYIWPVNTTDLHNDLLEKIEEKGNPLISLVDFTLGLTPYDKYKGHTQDQIKGKVFHADHQKDPTFRKLLKGNDVRRYQVSWNGNMWISYGDWLGAPREQRFFTEKRILVKQIIDWTSLRIWAALTNEELYNTQNAFNLLQNSSTSLEYILGILNSRLLNFYHQKRFLDEFKMRFQKILIRDCKRFPIRPIDPSDQEDAQMHEKMVVLVKKMLALSDTQATENNPQTLRLLENQITATDRQIDHLVYELYELSSEEIELVEQL
jgi:type I restriction-modification system DNA methylase subunit